MPCEETPGFLFFYREFSFSAGIAGVHGSSIGFIPMCFVHRVLIINSGIRISKTSGMVFGCQVLFRKAHLNFSLVLMVLNILCLSFAPLILELRLESKTTCIGRVVWTLKIILKFLTLFLIWNSISFSSLQDTSHSLCLSDLSLISTDSELRENSNPVSYCLAIALPVI